LRNHGDKAATTLAVGKKWRRSTTARRRAAWMNTGGREEIGGAWCGRLGASLHLVCTGRMSGEEEEERGEGELELLRIWFARPSWRRPEG